MTEKAFVNIFARLLRWSGFAVAAVAAVLMVLAPGGSSTSAAPLLAPPQANLDQCRNGAAASPENCAGSSWVNGNLGATQAHYVEGYSAPYRVVMTDLPASTSVTLTLGYDIKHSGKHALDYLTHYLRLEPHTLFGHPAETVDPTSGVAGIGATTTTLAIPAPSSAGSPVPGQPATSFNALPAGERVMTLFGGTITGISYATQGDLTASQAETTISVTFTSHASATTAVLAWGGHIASRLDWGAGNSAGGISGSPYHMRLIGWSLGNLGQQDRSLAAAAVIVPTTPTVVTEIHAGTNHSVAVTSVPAGTTVHDKATVSGSGTTPTGTVVFSWFTNGTCSGSPAATSSALSLTSGAVDATGFPQGPLNAGSYSFKAHYNGDTNYTAADSACEPLTVTKLTPTVVTDIHDASEQVVTSVPAGSSVHDKATVSGSFGTPTGSVQFTFYFTSSTCTGDWAPDLFPVVLDGSGVAHPSQTRGPLAAGAYSFRALYTGNANYTAADSACEPLAVGALTPTVTSQIHQGENHSTDIQGTTVPVGTVVHDKAIVTGSGPTPTGTVDFRRYSTINCTGDSVDQNNVALSGGTAESSSFTTVAGVLSYQVHYDGDGNYIPVDGPCEPLTVAKLTPIVDSHVHDGSHTNITGTTVLAGTIVHDKGMVSGTGPTPSGTVDFWRFTNGTCASEPAGTQNGVALAGDGTAESNNFTTVAGSMAYKVHYNGDANYNAGDGPCEPLTVGTPPTPTATPTATATTVPPTATPTPPPPTNGGPEPTPTPRPPTATPTPQPTSTPITEVLAAPPVQLPKAGGPPIGLVSAELLGLAMLGLGWALRRR